MESLEGGISENDRRLRQAEVDRQVDVALESIFGAENLQRFPQIRPLLRIGLACHLFHREAYDKLLDPRNPRSKLLPDFSPFRSTPLFTIPSIAALKEHAAIAMPWEGKSKYFKQPTGLPPHSILHAYMREMKELIIDVPQKIENMLNRRQMNGPLSLDQIVRAVENGPRMSAIAADLSSLRQMVAEGGTSGSGSAAGRRSRERELHSMRLLRQYRHSDGQYKRVPVGWKFPVKLALQSLYAYWHIGDEVQHVPPMKYLENSDVNQLGKRARSTLSEIRKVMLLIDTRATDRGLTVKDRMTHIEVNSLFNQGMGAIGEMIDATTPTDRHRNISKLKISSVVTYIQKKRRNDRNSSNNDV